MIDHGAPTTPDERRRRCLSAFARRLLCYLGRDRETRDSIVAIAARIEGMQPGADRDAAIDAMDGLLSGE